MFTTVYPRARTVALRILGSVPAAEDAAAEALARALAAWPRIARLPHREPWVLRVTVNVAIDAARRRQGAAPQVPAPSPDDVIALRATLVSALAALPRRQRESIVLHHMAGLPQRDVADVLGVSPNTVKKHLQRGLARLRTTVTIDEGELVGLE